MNTKIKKYIQSLSEPKKFSRVMYGLGAVVIAVVIFQAGMFVGFHKASFGRSWGENYSRNFGPRSGKLPGPMPENFPNSHGAIGKIIKVELPTLILEDRDGTEKIILITDDTKIRKMREEGTGADLTVDSYIVVIGSPNTSGQIEAKLVRMLPAPPDEITTTPVKPIN